MILCIDHGATLTKIFYANGEKTASNSCDFRVKDWISGVDEVRATGIRSAVLPESVEGISIKKFDEFEVIPEAAGGGTIAVTVGTGTSIVDTEKKEHLGGTGVGGGTIMGLCSIIAGNGNFEHYETLAESGISGKTDLLVGDVSEGMGILSREVTASNLAKLSRDSDVNNVVRGVFNLVGEVVGTLSCFALRSTGYDRAIFLGSAMESELLISVVDGVFNLYGCRATLVDDPMFAIAKTLLIF